MLTGAYSMSLVTGATVATFTAIPFENAFGGWEAALAVWALPALVAAAVWLPLAVRAHDPVPAPVGTPLWREPVAWSIALFMGLQSMAFFSTITWLPEILESDGSSEGFAGFLVRRHPARPDRARVRDPGARRPPRRRRRTCWR